MAHYNHKYFFNLTKLPSIMTLSAPATQKVACSNPRPTCTFRMQNDVKVLFLPKLPPQKIPAAATPIKRNSDYLHLFLPYDKHSMTVQLFFSNIFVDDFCRTFCFWIANGLVWVDVENHGLLSVLCWGLKCVSSMILIFYY